MLRALSLWMNIRFVIKLYSTGLTLRTDKIGIIMHYVTWCFEASLQMLHLQWKRSIKDYVNEHRFIAALLLIMLYTGQTCIIIHYVTLCLILCCYNILRVSLWTFMYSYRSVFLALSCIMDVNLYECTYNALWTPDSWKVLPYYLLHLRRESRSVSGQSCNHWWSYWSCVRDTTPFSLALMQLHNWKVFSVSYWNISHVWKYVFKPKSLNYLSCKRSIAYKCHFKLIY